MTVTDKPAPRAATWSQRLGAAPVFVLAGIGAVAGIFWFPLWFLAAELLRLWAPRGGMRWLSSRGVPEYGDERWASAIGIAPMVLIALRIALALDWIAPFRILTGGPASVTASELTIFQASVLGLALATSLAGLLRTTGWPRVMALAGFAATAALVVVALIGVLWRPSALEALTLLVPAYVVSTVAIRVDRRLYRQAARRLGGPEIADSGRWERP